MLLIFPRNLVFSSSLLLLLCTPSQLNIPCILFFLTHRLTSTNLLICDRCRGTTFGRWHRSLCWELVFLLPLIQLPTGFALWTTHSPIRFPNSKFSRPTHPSLGHQFNELEHFCSSKTMHLFFVSACWCPCLICARHRLRLYSHILTAFIHTCTHVHTKRLIGRRTDRNWMGKSSAVDHPFFLNLNGVVYGEWSLSVRSYTLANRRRSTNSVTVSL